MDMSDHQNVVSSAADAVDLFVPGIKAAVKELEEKHGPLTTNGLRAYAIMQREMGEVSDAILDITKVAASGVTISDGVKEAMTQHLAHEVAQVIAVGVYMLINLFGDRVHTENAEPPVLVPGSGKVM